MWGVGCALATAIILLALRDDGVVEPLTPTKESPPSPAIPSAAEIGDQRVPPETPSTQSVRDYLRSYYGADWEKVRAGLEESMGKKLDAPLEENPVRPWDEVAEAIRKQLIPSTKVIEQHAETALNWDPSNYENWDSIRSIFPNVPESMRDVELREFQGIAEAANASIRELAQQRIAGLADLGAYKWAQGDFVKAPYCIPASIGAQKPGRVALIQMSTSSTTGWVVNMPIYADELPPEYATLGKAIDKGIVDRTRQLSNYLDSKK